MHHSSRTSFKFVAVALTAIALFLIYWQLEKRTPLADTPPPAAVPIAVPDENRGAWEQDRIAGQEKDSPDSPSISAASNVAVSPVQAVSDFAKITAFNDWAKRWDDAPGEARAEMIGEGRQLAAARRPAFKSLIVTDPQMALEQAVPRRILQDLPTDITQLLEKPVSTIGDYQVYRGRPQHNDVRPAEGLVLRYFETPTGESYKARVYGARAMAPSKHELPLRGVAIDRELAVAESPVRPLEIGERIPAGTAVNQTCLVSRKTTAIPPPDTPITSETPAVEIGGAVTLLCDPTHTQIVDEEYRAAAGQVQASGPGGAGYFFDSYPGTSSEAIGNFRCLYIRITYPDQMRAPNTEDSAYSDMRNVSRYYLEASYGKLTTTSVVTPLVVLPYTQAWYIAKDSEQDGLGLVHSHARAEARKLGYDSNQFNCTIVRVNGGPRLSGISWGGGDRVWVSWDGMDVLNHECGHSLGLNHANFWQTTDGTAYGTGANQEYGNSYDVMGGGSGFGAHYNTISKRLLTWLPDLYIHTPKVNGVFRLFAYDQPQLEEGKRYALRVAKDSVRNYYVEYHPAAGGQWPNSALLLYTGMGSNAGHLLDTTPGSSGGKGDGGIAIGQTYSDPEADLHLTVLGKNSTSPPSLDVAVYRGPFGSNAPPTVNLTATATTISAGGSITFTASATDPDGDALSYHWDFNDGVATTNTPVFTRSFPSVDQMTVMVTVSDMKGGVARRSILVNVGNHGRYTITGQVMNGAQPLMGVRISDGTKYCFTDSQGNYILSDLTLASRTLTATLNGYAFTPQFANPITVVAGTNTGNWASTQSPMVSLAVTADAAEGGANGSFLLTRTGDTSAALVVRVAPVGGTATKTTDYTFTPDYATDGSFRTFTIPAGQASLPVTVAAVNDTTAEGPETISLQVAANPGYLTFSGGVATMTLNDDDSTLPKVSVIATSPYASEVAGQTGAFTFSRSGPVTNSLNVTVAYSGTATNGSDYTLLPTNVVIPAGQASVTVGVPALNDAVSEGPEDCIATISSAGTYLRESTAQTATITVIDDDLPVITVSVLDADAAEANRDPGVFLLSRTGSTAAPLKVYYGLSGSALHGTDYLALTGEVIFPAGASSVPVVITPYDDDLGEPETQSVTLNVTTFNSAYTVGSNFTGTLNITDNDDIPVVSVRSSATANEPSTNGSFIFRSTASASGNITIHYTVSGTATAGTDYTALSGTAILSANGSNEVTVSVPVIDDDESEDTETVIVTITPDPSYRVYNDGSAVTRIRDNENAERIAVSAGRDPTLQDYPAEGGVAGRFYIARVGTTGDLTVNYTLGGTAVNGTDYTALPGTVTIPAGASGVDVVVTPVNDSEIEGTETIILSVASGAGYAADDPSSAMLYLIDNETAPITVGFTTASSSTTEAPGALGEFRDFTVSLSAPSTQEVTVEYTSAGGTASGDNTDWTYVDAFAGNAVIPGGLLKFPPGTTSKTIRIRVRNDGVVEGDETAILDLRNPRFARLSSVNRHTLTITDANDPVRRVRFLISASTVSETQGSEPMLMAVLDRPPAAGNTVSVNYIAGGTATAGSDYMLPPGPLTFAAGETVKLLPLTVIADAQTEAPESLIITLSSPSNAVISEPSTHTITLRESTLPAVSIVAVGDEVGENDGLAQFTVSRSGPGNSLPLTVSYTLLGTAAASTDYTPPPGTIVIPAGENSATLAVTLINDSVEEAAETLIATLQPSAAYELTSSPAATLTILDDDIPPTIAISSPTDSEVLIPNGVGLIIRAEGTRETPQGQTKHPVTWSKLSGPGDVVIELEDSTSVATTFSLPGEYVLRATSTAGTTVGTKDLRIRVGGTMVAQTVGATTAQGSWSDTGGTITVTGAGSGLSSTGTSDGFFYLAAPVSGDFDVRCRVTSISPAGTSASPRFGLMVRASTAANAVYASSHYRGDRSHGFHTRLTTGAATTSSVGTTQYALPNWVRLVRAGDNISAFYSTDGTTWTQRGSTVAMTGLGPNPLLGLAVTSANQASTLAITFDSLDFFLPTNLGPTVNAGSALSGAGPWTAVGSAADDAHPVPSSLTTFWRALSGPGSVTFGSASSLSTSVNFTASGAYRLRLKASDGEITTFDDTTATVTSTSPLEAWRQQNFGSITNEGDGADTADPDRDGLLNLLEYALGTSPKSPGPQPLQMSATAGELTLIFNRVPERTDVTLTLEGLNDLAGAATAMARSQSGTPFFAITPDVNVEENGASPVAVTATIQLAPATSHRFFRLRAQSGVPDPHN